MRCRRSLRYLPDMVSKDEMMPLLIDACPSFKSTFDSLIEIHGGVDIVLSLDDLADHIFILYSNGENQKLEKVSEVIEKLKLEGDNEVKRLLQDVAFRILDDHLRKP